MRRSLPTGWRASPHASLSHGFPSCAGGGAKRSRSLAAYGAKRRPLRRLFLSVPAIPVEYASARKIRERNKLYYRFNHWPIWIFVYFIAPGPLTFDLFEHGFDSRMGVWLGLVMLGT